MTPKKKNILLLIGFMLMMLLAYKLAISKTLNLSEEVSTLEQQKTLLTDLPNQINYLKQQNAYYDSELAENQISIESSFQNNLLKIINNFSSKNKLQITSFKEPHQFKTHEALTNTYKFSVIGSFNSILKLIHHFEKLGNCGKMISIDFQKKKNYKTNTVYLECEIYLQRIERID